jgi:hypothetical protein
VWVSIKNAPPYDRWGVEAVAKEATFVLCDDLPFDFGWFPGYAHQTTLREASQLDTRDARALRTLVFRRMRGARACYAVLCGRVPGHRRIKAVQAPGLAALLAAEV